VSRAGAIEPGPDVLDGHPSAALFERGLDFGASSAPSVRRPLALALGPLDAPRRGRRTPLRGRELERFARATTNAAGEVFANPRAGVASRWLLFHAVQPLPEREGKGAEAERRRG